MTGKMGYYIGIDGGGTTARALAVSEDGRRLGAARGGSTNIASNPPEAVRENLRTLVADLLGGSGLPADACLGLCIGSAGVDSEASRLQMLKILKELHLSGPRMAVNDALIALYAATAGKPGVILISGTGSIACGINEAREMRRAGGHDYLVSDEGSAYWVAKEGIRAALRHADGIGAPTCLGGALCARLRLRTPEELADYVYAHNKSEVAALCGVVSDACGRGDPAAVRIMEQAAEELALLVKAVLEGLRMTGRTMPVPLVLAGGFLKNDGRLREHLKAVLLREEIRVELTEADAPAEWGAVLMAQELAGKEMK